MCLEFCHWLHMNCHLLPLILFTGEVTFTRKVTNNIRNSHGWCHDNPHGTVETNLQRHISFTVWCGSISPF
jgi:hypothetical protein